MLYWTTLTLKPRNHEEPIYLFDGFVYSCNIEIVSVIIKIEDNLILSKTDTKNF